MLAVKRRKFRLPVLSRLTQAWLGALGIAGIAGVIAIVDLTSGAGPGRISLAVEDVEFLARAQTIKEPPEERLISPNEGLRLGAPSLRDGGVASNTVRDTSATIEGIETTDSLLYPDEYDLAEASPNNNDIIIRIPGSPKAATPVTAASLTPVRAITDPDPALLRATPFGKAPRISSDGRKAMREYAKHHENRSNKPQIAIIVGGLGLNPALTERAIDELPPEISLAFAPYAKDLNFWAQKARAAGHEIIIELPMEGYGDSNKALGAAGLLTTREQGENLQRLDWLMSRFQGYFAATNYMGAKFSTENSALSPILQTLRESGIAYIDDTGAAEHAARQSGVALVSVSRVIPPAPERSQLSAVRRELSKLEAIAKENGVALGKTYAYGATLEELVAWTNSLEKKGFTPAPASAVLQANASFR
ncbi:MAG: hypothetical protein DHS20C05_06420 [Hyphococcus sp.]|nr:MAG: hypothetical protein DHS20C05_06420 [Marinicaulis sp.]